MPLIYFIIFIHIFITLHAMVLVILGVVIFRFSQHVLSVVS